MLIQIEKTPNPNSLKFLPGKEVSTKSSFEIKSKDKINNELVRNIFSVNGVTSIFLGKDFICGFYGANCLLPGARGQVPHLDYPYMSFMKAGEKIPFINQELILY